MQPLFELSLPIRMVFVFLCATVLGSLVNWAIYQLAWNPREISPWGPTPKEASARKASDRIPILGWFGLRRESEIHGPGFWIRPMLLELAMGLGLGWLYWWEVDQQSLVVQQIANQLRIAVAMAPRVSDELTHAIFLSHVVLIVLMVAASFIDIDEKIIPDEITIPGTLLGLMLATLLPISLLPQTIGRLAPHVIGEVVVAADDVALYVEPVTAAAPNVWPEFLEGAPRGASLLVAQACWWLWCFALTPRIWRGRHGAIRALHLILRRVVRELMRPPLAVIAWPGSLLIVLVWWLGGTAWIGLLTSLIGMVVAGGMIWAVRIVGSAALQREAMGFGDVTLMMMVGAFLGWQAGVMIFFISPLAGLIIGLVQLVFGRGDVIPYGPFLCLGSAVVAIRWSNFWSPNVQDLFQHAWLIGSVLIVSFVMLGLMLGVWNQIKMRLFQ